MQISALSAFKGINFKSLGTYTDSKTGVPYDGGQPCGPTCLKEDTFTKNKLEKAEERPDRSESLTVSDLKREPIPVDEGTITGYNNHEAYLY